jgi:hypothetical protein
VCLCIYSWREVVEHMTLLLDPKLRKKSGTKFYKDELCALVRATIRGAMKITAETGTRRMPEITGEPGEIDGTTVHPPRDQKLHAEDSESDLVVMPPLFDDDSDEEIDPATTGVLKTIEKSISLKEPNSDTDHSMAFKKQSSLVQAVEKYMDKLSNSVDSDADIWDIIAEFYFAFSAYDKVAECRTKQVDVMRFMSVHLRLPIVYCSFGRC